MNKENDELESSDLLSRIEPYKALDGEAKCHITPPCKLCGWGPNEAIHSNPDLIGKGPYHDFESR